MAGVEPLAHWSLSRGLLRARNRGYTVNIYNNFNNYTVPGPAVVSFRFLFLLMLEGDQNWY
jgi:hypothetical protein